MILYHVSIGLNHNGLFIPRIPEFIEFSDDEDCITPRICFSDSIEGCLGSIPDGGRGLAKYIQRNPRSKYFKVFKMDTDEIEEEIVIIPPYELVDRVPDSMIHREYWVLDSIKLTNYFTIEIIDFDCDVDTNRISNLVYSII